MEFLKDSMKTLSSKDWTTLSMGDGLVLRKGCVCVCTRAIYIRVCVGLVLRKGCVCVCVMCVSLCERDVCVYDGCVQCRLCVCACCVMCMRVMAWC